MPKIKAKPKDYIPLKTIEQIQRETYQKIQNALTLNEESEQAKTQKQEYIAEKLLKENSELQQLEADLIEQILQLEKQRKQSELRATQNFEKISELTLETAKLENIQARQHFDQYVKDMEEAGIKVKVDEK